MNFQLLEDLPRERAKTFLEHILRSIHYGYKLPFSIKEDEPWVIVDKDGKQFADCHRSDEAQKFFTFLTDLDAFLV